MPSWLKHRSDLVSESMRWLSHYLVNELAATAGRSASDGIQRVQSLNLKVLILEALVVVASGAIALAAITFSSDQHM